MTMISRRSFLAGLLTAAAAAEANAFGVGRLGGVGKIGQPGGAYRFTPTDANAIALFNAMVVKPSLPRQSLIQSTIVSLKANSIWALIDTLQVYAGHDANAVLIDWKVPSRVASLVNAPTFSVDRHYATDGISQYIDTNYNPTTNAVSYAQDSAFVGYWPRTADAFAASAAGWFDGVDGLTLNPRTSGGNILYRINQATGVQTGAVITDARGLTLVNRSGASAIQIDKNSVQITTGTTASATLNNATFNVGRASATGFVAANHSIFMVGGSLNSTMRGAIYGIFNSYMTAIGAA